jgi:hypothetical protein
MSAHESLRTGRELPCADAPRRPVHTRVHAQTSCSDPIRVLMGGCVCTESSLGACTLPMTSVIAGRAAAAGLRLYLYAWVAFGRPHVCGVRPSTAQRHGVCLCLC